MNPAQFDSDFDGVGNACDPDLLRPNNNQVDFGDLGVLKESFFASQASPPCPDDTPGVPPGCWNPDADLTDDGQVNFADLGRMKDFFFGPPGPTCTTGM